MKHLDLFSGIGGFALAADRAFGEVEHTFCEIDPFCQEVLKKHWPNSKIYGDIRTLTNTNNNGLHGTKNRESNREGANSNPKGTDELCKSEGGDSLRPEIITGGFPCQPFSQAGRRKGTADDRYLWPEMLRVIREFAPLWVIGENVGGFVTWSNGMVLRQVFSDLESEGYEIQAFIIPALAVNAPHRRDRIWIVANRKYERQEKPEKQTMGSKQFYKNTPDPGRKGHTRKEYKERQDTGYSRRPQWDENWIKVAARLCRMDDGLPRRLDRNPRLKALGNAIVPQVAEEIMRAIPLLTTNN